MAVLQITSREFRDNQKSFFELADEGEQIIIRRKGKNRAYTLTPIDTNDLILSPALKKKIEKGLQDIKDGKGREYSLEELRLKMGL